MARSARPLTSAVRRSVRALNIGPGDAALVALALELASCIDAMPAEVKARMLGQTSGALTRVLDLLQHKGLRAGVVPRRASTRDELKARRDGRLQRAVAAREQASPGQ